MKTFILTLILFPLLSLAEDYPPEWFVEIPRSEAYDWEILPQDAKEGEVILSKRTELGVFSNFAATSFTLDGKSYASVEGLWQSMKYPDPELPNDPRHTIAGWPHTRAEVEQMVAFVAKEAGDEANQIYAANKLKKVSYGSNFFNYKDYGAGSDYHYVLMKRAMKAKLDQNPHLWTLLMRTGCLILKPDHKVGENDPPSYQYYKIYMQLRGERHFVPCEIPLK